PVETALAVILRGNRLVQVGQVDWTDHREEALDGRLIEGNDTIRLLVVVIVPEPLDPGGRGREVGKPVGVADVPATEPHPLSERIRWGQWGAGWRCVIVAILQVERGYVAVVQPNDAEAAHEATG